MGLYLGIFLVTLSGLMFEIGLTRIFSATIWYHYAFVAISVALLGWGLGGFVLHLLRGRLTLSRERAALLTLLYGVSIPLALWLIVRVPFHPDRLAPLLRGVAACRSCSRVLRSRCCSRVEPRAHRTPLLRRPGRRLARRPRRHVPALVARRRECRAGGGARAARGGGRVLAPAARAGRAPRGARAGGARRERAQRPVQDPLARPPRASIATWRRLRARRSRSPAGTRTRGSTRSRASSTRTWPASTSTPTPGPTSCPGTATSRASRRSASGTGRCRSRSRPRARRRW